MYKHRIEDVKKEMLQGIDNLEERLEKRKYVHRITECFIWSRPGEVLFDIDNNILFVDLDKYVIAPLECVDKKAMESIRRNCWKQHGTENLEKERDNLFERVIGYIRRK